MVQLIGNPNKNLSFEEYANGRVRFTDIDTHIYDLRGKAAAFSNKFKGKGYESTLHYYNCEIFFRDIPNIHSVRDAYETIAKLTEDKVNYNNGRTLKAGTRRLASQTGSASSATS